MPTCNGMGPIGYSHSVLFRATQINVYLTYTLNLIFTMVMIEVKIVYHV